MHKKEQIVSKFQNKLDFIKRKKAFVELGQRLSNIDEEVLKDVIDRSGYKNPWFTQDNIRLSLNGLINYLDEKRLNVWINKYDISNVLSKKVGLVMAGNIPLVGIHDMICVLISGHGLIAKMSSQDDVLIPFIVDELIKIEPEFKGKIEFVDRLKGMDAVIATGSNNTSRYFDYYFSKYPNVIRKNRTSIAVLNGEEKSNELINLGQDIFSYFGLGCRNVSKVYLPTGYGIEKLIPHLEDFKDLIHHNKYGNNYFYQRSIFLVNQTPHLDNGFSLFQQNENLASPISVLFYDYYDDVQELKNGLSTYKDQIQCVVSNMKDFENRVVFGKAQTPEISDYADGIDTMDFLSRI